MKTEGKNVAMRQIFFYVTLMVTLIVTTARALELDAKAYYVGHPETDTIIFAHNENEPVGPASLTKMMTLYMLFDAIKHGDITEDSMLPISEKAWKKGGSKMFLEVGKTAKVSDLIKGIAVSSGNDACIVVAEYLGGTEDAFAEMMNEKAKELGMMHTVFRNASGWPHPEQKTTAKDMYYLGKALFEDFPEHYDVFSQRNFQYSNIKQGNRNGLLDAGIGVDGIKTGHTEEAGYHLVSSAKRGDDRLVAAVLGTSSMKQRENETAKALSLIFAQYDAFDILKTSNVLEKEAEVWLGNVPTTGIIPQKDVKLYIPRKDFRRLSVKIKYKEPLLAPIQKGDVVGTAIIKTPEREWEIPLTSTQDVAEANLFTKFKQVLAYNLGF
jgi:D-alanyl-D-alanine carboxypeptidase (penicillin-binding protein 5/6)